MGYHSRKDSGPSGHISYQLRTVLNPHSPEGTSIEDVRSAFAQTDIDHVIMGAGLELETRLQIVREVFQSSDKTSVHMKDRVTGPQGFLPFVQSVLRGLKDY